MDVCRVCGIFLPPLTSSSTRRGNYHSRSVLLKCNICPDGGKIEEIMVPAVYKYMIAEMGSVNLRVCMKPANV